MKVTFDKNVYEYIVSPEKDSNGDIETISCYRNIRSLITSGKIQPFISETILTYETIKKIDRKNILSNPNPLLIAFKDEGGLTISSNPNIHPGHSTYDDIYINQAIELGFKILPDRRFGKLINPAVQNEWYYIPEEGYFPISEKFSEVLAELDSLDVGFKVYQNLLGLKKGSGLKSFNAIAHYSGNIKKLNEALSERSDGNSVALHIANNLDFFCTYDKGMSTRKSVFNESTCQYLKRKFGFIKGTPFELVDFLNFK